VEVLQRGVLAVVVIGLAWYVWRRLVQPRLVGEADEG
jgi:hypothetical protein